MQQELAGGKLEIQKCSADFSGKRLRFGIERHHLGRNQIISNRSRHEKIPTPIVQPPVAGICRCSLSCLLQAFASREAMETNRLHKTKNMVALKISPSYLFDTMRSCRKPQPMLRWVKIGWGRELVNPIYHHRNLLLKGKTSKPSMNQLTNGNLGHLWS